MYTKIRERLRFINIYFSKKYIIFIRNADPQFFTYSKTVIVCRLKIKLYRYKIEMVELCVSLYL